MKNHDDDDDDLDFPSASGDPILDCGQRALAAALIQACVHATVTHQLHATFMAVVTEKASQKKTLR